MPRIGTDSWRPPLFRHPFRFLSLVNSVRERRRRRRRCRSGLGHCRCRSFSSFDRLPVDVQSRILALLPITTLVVCKAVSRSWRSFIRSPAFTDSYRPTRDPIFLLFSDQNPIRSAFAYLPSVDRWIHFPFSAPLTTGIASTDPSSVARTLIFSDHSERYTIINPFSRDRPLDLLPPVIDPETGHTALALIEDSPSDYTVVVVVSFRDGMITQTYHSTSARWEPRGHTPLCAGSVGLETAVWHQGLLYCLSLYPDHFLTFDPFSGQWSILDVELPIPLSRCHLLSFGGDLYLTALTRHETPSQIGIWKLDQSAMIWWEFDFKPSELSIGGWFVVDCMGMISYSGYRSNKVLMCDLVEKRWWYSESSNVPSDASPWQWVGRTVEPPIDLVY